MPPMMSSTIMAVPRSGCLRMKTTGTRPTASTEKKFFQPRGWLSRARRRATRMSTAILMGSEGWMVNSPKDIQRLAP